MAELNPSEVAPWYSPNIDGSGRTDQLTENI